jgi:hypothetical protein
MPRGIKNTPPTLPSITGAGAVAEPTPLIMLQPHGDGIQFNAYGLEIPEMVDALRLAIVHLVGKQAGIKVFDEVISRQQRVWVPQVPSATFRIVPSSNGKKPGKPAIKRLPRFDDDDEPDLREDLAAALDEIGELSR